MPVNKDYIINNLWDNPVDLLSCVPKMMDEYAKQIVIDFERWKRLQEREGNREIYGETPEQLFNLYKSNS